MRGLSNESSAGVISATSNLAVMSLTTSGNLYANSLILTGSLIANGVSLLSGNITANSLTLTGNITAASLNLSGRVLMSDSSTAGNAGIIFSNGTYQGAFVERRTTTSVDRYGTGVYGTAMRTYAGGSAGGATTSLGFALGEASFLDVLTATRDNASTTKGNVGINTTAPQCSFHVVGNVLVSNGGISIGNLFPAANGIVFSNTSYQGALVEQRANASERYGVGVYAVGVGTFGTRVYASGSNPNANVGLGFSLTDTTFVDGLVVTRNSSTANVGINVSAPQAALHVVGATRVDGSVTASGDVTAFSDRRLKSNLLKVETALAKLQQVTGYTYDREDMPGRRYAGLIAQDVQAVLPEAVFTGDDGTLSLSATSVLALLVESVKELHDLVVT